MYIHINQKIKNMNKMTLLKTIIIVVFISIMTAVIMSSCTVSSKGFGCPGPQQNWIGCGGNR